MLSVIRLLAEDIGNKGFSTSFFTSFFTILVCEIGDKTFFLAMVMAMKYKKWVVFGGGYGALAVMTVLSTIFGAVITTLISKTLTDLIVTALFFYFGGKLIWEAYHEPDEGNVLESEQMKETEKELQEMHERLVERVSGASHDEQIIKDHKHAVVPVIPDTMILWQAFSLTFLAEWGDRSQIATIALGASYSVVAVTIGALLGHFICTLGAVELGEWIGKRVRERTVHMVAGIVFILSGFITLIAMFVEQENEGGD